MDLLDPANAIAALCALNFVAFAAFGFDKAQAENGGQRVRESTLLWLAFLGGSPGAYAGRSAFRHKTRKEPFNANLRAIFMVQVGLIAAAIWYFG